jgi:hypothetical protein
MTHQTQAFENPDYIIVKMFYDAWERERGDGYYPLVERSREEDTEIYETFFLNNLCAWEQHNIYDAPENATEKRKRFGKLSDQGIMYYLNIKGLDGDTGIKLLNLLNNESKRIQLENGVLERDLRLGDKIYNLNGIMMKVITPIVV